MFDLAFEFEFYPFARIKSEIENYLNQNYNQDRYRTYKNNHPKELFNIPDTATIVFGNAAKKNTGRITRSLKSSEVIYTSLGLGVYKPDEVVELVCEELYDSYTIPTIRSVNDKVLFYLLLQFDSGFVRWNTTKDEYKFLSEAFNSDYPTFSTAERLLKLQSFN